jgi:geranylgeranyl diphosphate synthase, type II
MSDLKEYLAGQQARIDAILDRLTPLETAPPETIHKAMRYSLFAGGKRIRPILCVEAAKTISDHVDGVEAAAASLEMVHTYSLIHDDLPALDNDDYRRGKLTCHKVFGDAIAILAGDALLTLAFRVLASLTHVASTQRSALVAELAEAAGTTGGMIGGQVADLEGEGKEPSDALLEAIHSAKTGALLRASLRMGVIYAGGSQNDYDALSRYGDHVGLAFQIVDDILDVEGSSEALGKTAGKDAHQKKITFPAVYGLEESKRMADRERELAAQALEPFGDRAVRLRQLADLIVERRT